MRLRRKGCSALRSFNLIQLYSLYHLLWWREG